MTRATADRNTPTGGNSADRTRVLVVSPTLTSGGAERFVSNLLCHLDSDRFEACLCLMEPRLSYPVPDGLEVVSLGKKTPWHIPGAVWRLRREIQARRPHVVLGNMLYTGWVLGAAMLGMRPRPARIVRFANSPLWEFSAHGAYGPLVRLARLPVIWLAARATFYVTNSRAVKPEVRAFLGKRYGQAAQIRVLGNPFDFDRLESLAAEGRREAPPGVPILIWIGRLSKQKRPDVLIEAFHNLCQRRRAQLLICGDGPLRSWLADEIERRNLTGHVRLLGFQENPYALMRQATALLLTSDYEGLPNVLIEAQGLGLPAVSTRCAHGADEIIEDGVTGLLVPTDDPIVFAEAVQRLLDDEQLAGSMGLAASRRARRLFSTEAVMKPWEALLEECRGALLCAE